jgi:hypothetical protein
MKSFVNVAPEFPPPPYTWLTTMFGDGAEPAVGVDAEPNTKTNVSATANGARPRNFNISDLLLLLLGVTDADQRRSRRYRIARVGSSRPSSAARRAR